MLENRGVVFDVLFGIVRLFISLNQRLLKLKEHSLQRKTKDRREESTQVEQVSNQTCALCFPSLSGFYARSSPLMSSLPLFPLRPLPPMFVNANNLWGFTDWSLWFVRNRNTLTKIANIVVRVRNIAEKAIHKLFFRLISSYWDLWERHSTTRMYLSNVTPPAIQSLTAFPWEKTHCLLREENPVVDVTTSKNCNPESERKESRRKEDKNKQPCFL